MKIAGVLIATLEEQAGATGGQRTLSYITDPARVDTAELVPVTLAFDGAVVGRAQLSLKDARIMFEVDLSDEKIAGQGIHALAYAAPVVDERAGRRVVIQIALVQAPTVSWRKRWQWVGA
jgi:hypothetical protein